MPENIIGELKSAPCITRYPEPVLAAKDIPYKTALVFNAGVTKYQGKYVMVFRNDYGSLEEHRLEGTNLGLAFSDDGITWEVQPQPCFALEDEEIIRAYDPRLTVIDGQCYMCFAVDTKHGLRGGIAVTEDFYNYEILSMTLPDNRNMVLFPELINGMYVRLERPFPVYSRGGGEKFDVWCSDSPDLRYWGNSKLVLGLEKVPYCNSKIGPAAPPIKTDKGWLTTLHTVDFDPSRGKHGWEAVWQKRYCAGIMLLDPDDPSKVIGLSRQPLLAPEAWYELDGFRGNAIFPGGMILEDTGEVKIYYGAGDAVEALATAHVDDLLALCEPV